MYPPGATLCAGRSIYASLQAGNFPLSGGDSPPAKVLGCSSRVTACLKCCGSGMLTIAPGYEFQDVIVRGKYEYI